MHKGQPAKLYDAESNGIKYALLFGEHNMVGTEGMKEGLPTRRPIALPEADPVTHDLTAKALIGIDIMKPERMMVDLGNNVMKVGACDDIEVPIVAVARGASISATIYSSKRITISAHFNVAVPVTRSEKALDLSDDRDLLFESKTLNTLSVYAYIVNHNVSKIFVRNNSNKPITLPRKQKLSHITNYNASAYCYSVQSKNHDLTIKALKRQLN